MEYQSDDSERIMSLIISKGAMFPTEISRDLLLTIEQVNAILAKLINAKQITRIIPNREYPQPLIQCRIQEMWAKGVFGYTRFMEHSWYIATEEGVYNFAARHKGEHRQIVSAYIHTYDVGYPIDTSESKPELTTEEQEIINKILHSHS